MKKLLAYIVSALVMWSPIAAHAGMATSQSLIETPVETLVDTLVDNAAFMQQMADMGVSQAQFEARLAQLTPDERSQLALRMSELPAGGDILSLAFLVFIVFIITDMLGATDVFTFVNEI
jgi:type IV secretory pathway VirB2 component (pilin)